MTEFTGGDDLREKLKDIGFTIYKNGMAEKENQCNWLAYRKTTIPTKECECNEKDVQIAFVPYVFYDDERILRKRVQIDITGEYDNVWYELKAYGISIHNAIKKIDKIEKSLVFAWNALHVND